MAPKNSLRKARPASRAEDETFRLLFDNHPIPMWVYDLETLAFLEVNDAAAEKYGYTRAEFLRMTLLDIRPAEDAPRLYADVAQAQPALQHSGGWRHRLKDGRVTDVEITSHTLEFSGRRAALVVAQDITERKRAEETLRESEQRYHSLFENMLEGYAYCQMLFDQDKPRDFIYVDVNHAFEVLTGLKNVVGKKVSEVIPGIQESNPELFAIYGRVALTGKPERFETYLESLDIWFSVSVYSPAKEYFIAVFDNITKRRRAEEEIRQFNVELEQRVLHRTQQLEHANQELEAFAYSVSHDLRAPLRAIDGFSRIVAEDYADKLDAEGNRLLNVIRTNSQKMDQLITDLLALARVSRSEMRSSRIDMTTLAGSIYHEVAAPEARQRIAFSVVPLPDAYGDPTLMRQVWSNLLSNAIKYTLPRDERRIEVGSYLDNGRHIYFVKDSGVGFNPDYTHKLFGLFQRLHKAEEFEGTGVGLAIVRRIILRHGGQVWAEGSINAGATFYFSLPQQEMAHE